MAEVSSKLELRDLIKLFGEVRAVDGVNLQIAPGESVVLLGPSGCGKTATLRSVAGFIQPDGGEILLDGQKIAADKRSIPPEHPRLRMVFRNHPPRPHNTR